MNIDLPTGHRYAPTIVTHDALYFMVFHDIPWYCKVMHGQGFYGIVWYILHSIARYYVVLDGFAL